MFNCREVWTVLYDRKSSLHISGTTLVSFWSSNFSFSFSLSLSLYIYIYVFVQSAGAVEYTDSTSAAG